MHRYIATIALLAISLSTAVYAGDTLPKKRWKPGAWWLSLGSNGARVEDSEMSGCLGGQMALGLGRAAFVKAQRTEVTYEESDRTDSCDDFLAGDSSLYDNALLVGMSARNSGLFVALGPARVHSREHGVNMGKDTGTRFELGWSSRRARFWRSIHGVEVFGFAVNNDVNSYRGIAVNWTIGPRGTTSAPRRPAR